ASVSVDGRSVPIGRPARVIAGPHLVAARAPGRVEATKDVIAEAGQVVNVRLEPELAPTPPPTPAPAVTAPAPAAPRPKRGSLRPGAATLGVLALALAGAGTGVYLVPWSEYSSKRDQCAGRCAPDTLDGL